MEVCKKHSYVQPSISPEAFAVFDTIIHCWFLVWEFPLECQRTLSCNFMGNLLAIRISGDE